MTKEQFIKRVLLIMNETGLYDVNGNSFLGADTAQVDRHIEGSYVDAWRRCIKVMPRLWFKNATFKTATLQADLEHGIGFVVLPDDFYLLSRFKMKGWKKPVLEAAIENERVASIQTNEYTRGSQIRPVCTISDQLIEDNDAETSAVKHVLNYYSLKCGLVKHEVEEAIYIPVCKPLKEIDTDEELELNDQLIEPLAYLVASTVFTQFEKYDISKSLEQRAVEMFPGLDSVRGTNITVKQ